MQSTPRPPPVADWLGRPMMALRAPVELVLTRALRQAARRKPFDRMGAYERAVFLIVPAGWPVGFTLSARANGRVTVVRAAAPGAYTTRIEGRIEDLLDLFDGSLDADAAFFTRTVRVEGDTGAALALHNTLEAAELSMSDILAPPFGGQVLDAGARALRAAFKARRTAQ